MKATRDPMLTDKERALVYDQAYVPEHLPDYVQSVSGAEPFLHESHICFLRKRHLTFIGYPLGSGGMSSADAYESACERLRALSTAIIAPKIWLRDCDSDRGEPDSYYRLELPLPPLSPDVAYMIRRASRDLSVSLGTYSGEHEGLVRTFISTHEVSPEHESIFERIPTYLKQSQTARLLEARRGKELAAFSIVDLGSARYGYYVFNFRSTRINAPGASDLLLHEMSVEAQMQGKKFMNLGLGISLGVRRFKEKWDASPFLPYDSMVVHRDRVDIWSLLRRL
ncbi:hypothetical protein ACFL2Q_07545 [Thermodesulfobacteriota bacterium]